MTAELDWFYRLPFAEQVPLLGDPRQAIVGEHARTLFRDRALMGSKWTSNDGGSRWSLDSEAAQQLTSIRQQLDEWWQLLTVEQRDYIAAHRDGELDKQYGDVVRGASRDPEADGPYAHLVVMVSDNKTGRFRLPQIIRLYVEMKAAE